MVKRLANKSFSMAKANAEAGVDAALTIAARAQNLLSPAGEPMEKAREAQLMVVEKMEAAVEGAVAAQAAWGALLIKAAFGGVQSPNDLSIGVAGVAEAAMSPALRRVRANARRLTGVWTLV
jgi:hypothetical protein